MKTYKYKKDINITQQSTNTDRMIKHHRNTDYAQLKMSQQISRTTQKHFSHFPFNTDSTIKFCNKNISPQQQ